MLTDHISNIVRRENISGHWDIEQSDPVHISLSGSFIAGIIISAFLYGGSSPGMRPSDLARKNGSGVALESPSWHPACTLYLYYC